MAEFKYSPLFSERFLSFELRQNKSHPMFFTMNAMGLPAVFFSRNGQASMMTVPLEEWLYSEGVDAARLSYRDLLGTNIPEIIEDRTISMVLWAFEPSYDAAIFCLNMVRNVATTRLLVRSVYGDFRSQRSLDLTTLQRGGE